MCGIITLIWEERSMSMRKAVICILLLIILLIPAGCSREEIPANVSDPAVQKPLCIVHYINPNGTDEYELNLYKLYMQFAEEKGIPVEIKTRAWDQLDKLLLLSTQSDEPLGDLFILSAQRLDYLVNSNGLLPLDDYFNASFSKDEFLDYALDIGTSSFDNRLYLIPQSLHTRGLWYNRDYVSKAPETLDELIETAQRVQQEHPGVYGFGFWGGNHYGSIEGTVSMLTWAFGGSLSDEAGCAAWSNSAVEDAIRWMTDCVYRYRISPKACLNTIDNKDIQDMFRNGEIAMLLDGSFTNMGGDQFSFSPVPGVDGFASNFANGWAWGIPVNSSQPDLAWEFIEWTQTKEFQIKQAILEGALPTRLDAFDSPQFTGKANMRQFADNLIRYARRMDSFVYYEEAMDALCAVLSDYTADPNTDLHAALAASQDLFNAKFY